MRNAPPTSVQGPGKERPLRQLPRVDVGKLLPQTPRARILAAVSAVLFLAILLVLTVLLPRSRAQTMVRDAAVPAATLDTALQDLDAATTQVRAVYARSAAIGGDGYRQVLGSAEAGQRAAEHALQAAAGVQFVVRSYGDAVSIGSLPVLFGDPEVAYARTHLTNRALTPSWDRVKEALDQHQILFSHTLGMARILRDFLAYNAQADMDATLALADQQRALQRIDRTLNDLNISVTEGYQAPVSDGIKTDQERWLTKLIACRAQLALVQQHMIAGDRIAAEAHAQTFIRETGALQNDLATSMRDLWTHLPDADVLQGAQARARTLAARVH